MNFDMDINSVMSFNIRKFIHSGKGFSIPTKNEINLKVLPTRNPEHPNFVELNNEILELVESKKGLRIQGTHWYLKDTYKE